MQKNLKIIVSLSMLFTLNSCYQIKKEFTDQIISYMDSDSNLEVNRKVIHDFYTAFKNGDAESMTKLYSDDVEFEDPAFGLLKGERAKDMWRMLVAKSKGDIKIDFHRINVSENRGSADWDAIYKFSQTGNTVHNKIHAQFIFKNGLIYRHKDYFDLWTWSKSALGLTGVFLGNTILFKEKLNEQANKGLDEFIANKFKK